MVGFLDKYRETKFYQGDHTNEKECCMAYSLLWLHRRSCATNDNRPVAERFSASDAAIAVRIQEIYEGGVTESSSNPTITNADFLRRSLPGAAIAHIPGIQIGQTSLLTQGELGPRLCEFETYHLVSLIGTDVKRQPVAHAIACHSPEDGSPLCVFDPNRGELKCDRGNIGLFIDEYLGDYEEYDELFFKQFGTTEVKFMPR
jgi:hypothetical protein